MDEKKKQGITAGLTFFAGAFPAGVIFAIFGGFAVGVVVFFFFLLCSVVSFLSLFNVKM